MNIFVFERQPALRDALSAFLRDDGCRIVAPVDFSEAAAAVTRERFDLIVCDQWMGEMDALSFFHFIDECQNTAIKVLVTERPTRTTRREIRWAGIDYVIHRSALFACMDTLKLSLAVAFHERGARAAP
jgi:DNA-binding response OmpR family regulator